MASSDYQCSSVFCTVRIILFVCKRHGSRSVVAAGIPVFGLMSKMTYSIHNTLIPILVKKEEWMTANTVLSITNTGIDLMFNAVAGVVLALFYLKTIFMVNRLINLAALVTAMFLFRKLSSKREFTDNETRTSVPSLKEVWKGY